MREEGVLDERESFEQVAQEGAGEDAGQSLAEQGKKHARGGRNRRPKERKGPSGALLFDEPGGPERASSPNCTPAARPRGKDHPPVPFLKNLFQEKDPGNT